jgi:hypothetical protein
MQKTIFDTNIVTFLKEVIKAIQYGYYAEASNAGYISCAHIYDINLYKKEAPEITKLEIADVVIYEHDAMTAVLAVQNAVLQGYSLDEESILWYNQGSKRIRMYIEMPTYTKEQLEELSWEEVKEVAKKLGVEFNRSRDILTNRILQKQDNS